MICTHQGCRTIVLRGKVCAKHQAQRLRGRALQKARANLFAEQALCVECDKQGKVSLATQRDHIQAFVNGGDESGECQPLCVEHHQQKTAADLGQTYRPKRKIGLDGWSVG